MLSLPEATFPVCSDDNLQLQSQGKCLHLTFPEHHKSNSSAWKFITWH